MLEEEGWVQVTPTTVDEMTSEVRVIVYKLTLAKGGLVNVGMVGQARDDENVLCRRMRFHVLRVDERQGVEIDPSLWYYAKDTEDAEDARVWRVALSEWKGEREPSWSDYVTVFFMPAPYVLK